VAGTTRVFKKERQIHCRKIVLWATGENRCPGPIALEGTWCSCRRNKGAKTRSNAKKRGHIVGVTLYHPGTGNGPAAPERPQHGKDTGDTGTSYRWTPKRVFPVRQIKIRGKSRKKKGRNRRQVAFQRHFRGARKGDVSSPPVTGPPDAWQKREVIGDTQLV